MNPGELCVYMINFKTTVWQAIDVGVASLNCMCDLVFSMQLKTRCYEGTSKNSCFHIMAIE